MPNRQLDEERIFHVARGISDAELRSEYLTQICAGDQALRERVAGLLEVHEQEQSFLKSNGVVEPTIDQSPVTEAPGQQIGRYKLLQKIGEGGFGVVYMAEQSRPVRRKVALKIIKPGMDTHAVVARFEAERQALALMDHPNIARILDGGATDSGRPYFVMELVKGVPITEYCDKNQLTAHECLQLFVVVCQAVQHAHQKGIIHRDLKPSNVLVTLHDGKPMIKVIDFGVAKAIHQQLTEKTLFTSFGQMVGTPQYMSPEQAEMSGMDVDTRSDVYSLGVLLYELLTGTTPLESDRLRTAGYAEMQRLIREEEPPKPSTRLSSFSEQLTVIAKHRSLSPQQLQKAVRGDLDWIVMKSLEKDRARRYETPSSFADDVERFLSDQPVEACPPSSSYRLRKFARRNRTLITTTSVVAIVLVAATVVSLWSAWEMKFARDQADKLASESRLSEEAVRTTLQELQEALKREAVEYAIGGETKKLDDAVAKAKEAGATELWANRTEGVAALFNGKYSIAHELLTECRNQGDDSAAIHSLLAELYLERGQLDQCFASVVEAFSRPILNSDDELFLAFAIYVDANRSFDIATQYFTEHKSPVALLVRARAQAWIALEHWDTERADSALQDVRIARRFFDRSNYVESRHLDVLCSALKIAKRNGDEVRIRQFTTEGESIGEVMQTNPHSAPSLAMLAYFFDTADQDIRAEDVYESAVKQGDNGWAFIEFSGFLTERKRFADAVKLLERPSLDSAPFRICRAIAMGEIPDRRKEAIDILNDVAQSDAILPYKMIAIGHLGFLGEQDLAFEIARAIHQGQLAKRDALFHPFDALLDVWAGESGPPDAILKNCRGPMNLGTAHGGLGAYYFAKHDYKNAQRHFDKASELSDRPGNFRTNAIYSRRLMEALENE